MKRFHRHPGTAVQSLPSIRRGTILVMFMLSLVLLSLTIAALIRVTLTQRELVRSGQLSLQSEWLFQSAAGRAASQLKDNPEYTGEEWTVSADQLNQPHDGIANIRVIEGNEETNVRRVEITVDYPADDAHRARVSRIVPIQK